MMVLMLAACGGDTAALRKKVDELEALVSSVADSNRRIAGRCDDAASAASSARSTADDALSKAKDALGKVDGPFGLISEVDSLRNDVRSLRLRSGY